MLEHQNIFSVKHLNEIFMNRLSHNAKVFIYGILIIPLTASLLDLILFFGFDIQLSKYDFSWWIVTARFVFFYIGMLIFLSYLQTKKIEFEAEQNYHRRIGKAAVDSQRVQGGKRINLMQDPGRFRRINHKLN